MTFRKRLMVAVSIVILLPVILFMLSFFIIGNYLVAQDGTGSMLMSYATLAGNMESSGKEVQALCSKVDADMEKNSTVLEDTAYLKTLSDSIRGSNSYIIVRKGTALYYTGNSKAAAKDFPGLPDYADGKLNGIAGYYASGLEKIVKQYDFSFSDGSKGSFFVLTRVVSLISKNLLSGMAMAMVGILLLTAVLLIRWLQRGIFKPINELNMAMNQIRDGNLEYTLDTGEDGEIGQLYRNYEDMRLRLKESADEKLEQEKANRELISNISHDLKTPITSIQGYVEGLLDGVANTPEKQHRYLMTIYNKSNDMTRLINELTFYSHMENDKIPYNFHKINVADYFGDCAEEVGMDLESRGIRLNYENLVDPRTMIIADPEQMNRVINNIISNSVKYMDKPDGRIDLRVLDEEDSVRVEIEDNGKGIAPEDIPRIFERFYRTDSSRNSRQGGSGIGLSIVKKIIEDHGGYIWATSPGEGEGTCMHFVIRKYVEKEDPDSLDMEETTSE